MEWLITLLENVDLMGIGGWIVSLLSVSIITVGWNVFKKGKQSFEIYETNKIDGWTEAEKNQYIAKSGEFWNSIKNFWSVIKHMFKRQKK